MPNGMRMPHTPEVTGLHGTDWVSLGEVSTNLLIRRSWIRNPPGPPVSNRCDRSLKRHLSAVQDGVLQTSGSKIVSRGLTMRQHSSLFDGDPELFLCWNTSFIKGRQALLSEVIGGSGHDCSHAITIQIVADS